MKIVAFIPARGGSKGIPRKNIRPLLGKPLIAWIIQSAQRSKKINRIIVSTDDKEIAEVAKKYGAEVPYMRPDEISHHLATDVEFLEHGLRWLEEKEAYIPDIVLRLPPTSPLCHEEYINQGIQKLLDTQEADAVRPITSAWKHPYKMWKVSKDEKWLEPFFDTKVTGFDEPHNLPRQLFPNAYVHTGAMDVMRRDTILKLKSTSGKKLAYFFMDPKDSINIDSIMDFELAEFFLKKRETKF